jgi:hypothetical protein
VEDEDGWTLVDLYERLLYGKKIKGIKRIIGVWERLE